MSAKKLLQDEATCASAVLYAAEALLGEGVFLWEPASIWLELHRQGIEVPVSNREQLMAARSLVTTGRYWYDANVFEKTCIAFNNEETFADGLEDAPVVFITWTVFEVEEIAKHYGILDTAVYDREATAYTAVQLYSENFVIAPDELSWTQESLTKRYPKDVIALQNKVREAWAAAPRDERLKDAAFPETPAGVQLAQLAVVQHYVNQRKSEYLQNHALLKRNS